MDENLTRPEQAPTPVSADAAPTHPAATPTASAAAERTDAGPASPATEMPGEDRRSDPPTVVLDPPTGLTPESTPTGATPTESTPVGNNAPPSTAPPHDARVPPSPTATPLPPAAELPPPPASATALSAAPEADSARPSPRLHRSRSDRMIAGVCGGVAQSLRIDPVILRLALVLATVLGVGAGVILYLACWILIPLEPEHEQS